MKSRPRRLRVTTGCRTCRKRHIKCDERKPTCANCGKKNRPCHYDAVVSDTEYPAVGSPISEPLEKDARRLGAAIHNSTPISPSSPLSPPFLATLGSILLSGAERWADNQHCSPSTLDLWGTQVDTLPSQSPLLLVDQKVELTEVEPFHRIVPVLAVRCPPLLHACLALSSKQMILVGTSSFSMVHDGAEVRYYRLALNAVSALLLHPLYAQSDEVLAACVVLSTYEMIDVMGESLGSHLKGIASLLQSRHIHGGMTGICGASYWTWYRHGIWASLQTGRKMSLDETYWKPEAVDTFESLPVEDITNRVLFLLGQCVNFFNDTEQARCPDQEGWARARNTKAVALEQALDEWKAKLPPSITCFPVPSSSLDGFQSIWFPFPQSAIAHQVYHACNIILSINRPPPSIPESRGLGIYSFLSLRQEISKSCEQIFFTANAGIPNAWSLVSAQCLYIAGLVMEGSHERKRTLELIDECQQRTGRKTVFLTKELKRIWGWESEALHTNF